MNRASVVALLLVGCGQSPPPPQNPGPAATMAFAPGLTPVDAELTRQLVQAPSDRARVVNLWATWCPPCVAELPALHAWAVANPNVDVVLLSVDHPAAAPKVRAFLERQPLPSLRSGHVQAEAALIAHVPGWADMLPYTLLVDEEGKELGRFVGAVDLTRLSEAVAKRPPRE